MNSQEQEAFVSVLKTQIKQCEMQVAQSPRHAESYSMWGFALLQLAVVENEIKKKQEFLKECRDRLNHAVKINPAVMCPDNFLAVLQLSNAYLISYIFEESDSVAEQLMEKCKKHYRTGFKKSPEMARALLQLDEAEKQRAEILAQTRRFKSLSPEELPREFLKFTYEKLDLVEAQVAASNGDAAALMASGAAHLDLSMVLEQMQDMAAAREAVIKSVSRLQESVAARPDKEAYNLLAIATNAVGMISEEPAEAKRSFSDARDHFCKGMELEEDKEKRGQLLFQLRDMYKTAEAWRELHVARAEDMELDTCPDWLAGLREDVRNLQPGQVMQIKQDEAQKAASAPTKKKPAAKAAAPAAEAANAAAAGDGDTEAKKRRKRNNKKKKKAGAPGGGDADYADDAPAGLDATTMGVAAGVTLVVALVAVYLVRRR